MYLIFILGFLYTSWVMIMGFYEFLKISSNKNKNFFLVLFGALRHDMDFKECKKRHLKRTIGIFGFIFLLVILTLVRMLNH